MVINFALGLLAIFLVIILYIKFSAVQRLEQDYRKLLKEAEETIGSYVYELKEENEAFLSKFKERQTVVKEQEGSTGEISFDKKEPEITQDDINSLLSESIDAASMDNNKKAIAFEELSTYDQVAILLEEGYTMEEIAKKLNKGKTEIELLWKIRQ
ncbi:rRNA maturation endonuclease Nob1 [Bacillus tianshenii]|uniref:rRNA maturation endonuclease Nob1 n=2 Tax=Sutcliffiella tianshenii TaxID=1463404 RepID=A0ABS2NWW2_9BACI|nr:rRNA maturation endonuclease Nob1 [Bacillus tianshenii]